MKLITEPTNYRQGLADNPTEANPLQGETFIELKRHSGWTPRYLTTDDDHYMAAIEKRIPLLGKVWYMPKGPTVTSKSELESIINSLRPFAKKQGVFTVKIEPELDYTTDLSSLGLIKTRPIQYNYSTVLIDLSPPVDDIMMSLNQKGRHAIRRAERDGVTVKQVPINDETCATMYQLFQETAGSAGFSIRSPEYYREFYQAYGDNGGLFFAYFNDQVVAGAFAMVQGSKSMYKDGASIRERTAYGASHLLQWEVIKWAKAKGSLEHDLAGVPPIAAIKNSDHPFYGLGRFKTSFNKTVTQYVGAYEVPISRWKTILWAELIEKIIRRHHFKKHQESYY